MRNICSSVRHRAYFQHNAVGKLLYSERREVNSIGSFEYNYLCYKAGSANFHVAFIQGTTVNVYYNNATSVRTMVCTDGKNMPSPEFHTVFSWYQLIILFLLPVLIMSYCYAVVVRVLWKSTKELVRLTHTRFGFHLLFSAYYCSNHFLVFVMF